MYVNTQFAPLRALVMLPESRTITLEQLSTIPVPGHQVVLDAYVERAEEQTEREYGFTWYPQRSLCNVDHHAPHPRFFKAISTTPLVARYRQLKGGGYFFQNAVAVVNHFDCDSALSAVVLSGLYPGEEERFISAALKADHTGEADDIADLLQSIQKFRNVEASLQALRAYLRNEVLPREICNSLFNRLRDRERAAALGATAVVENGVALLVADSMDATLIVPHIPSAKIIILARELQDGWAMSWRLGRAADGFTLFDLDIRSFDPNFGGRWNAGNNKRGGGTRLHPEQYGRLAEQALRRVEQRLYEDSVRKHT